MCFHMATCPVCRKMFKSEFGLVGHLRLKQDIAHIEYNNRINNRIISKPVQNDTTIALQKQVMTLTNELQALKEQPVQQQPIEEPKTKDLTIEAVDERIQRAVKQRLEQQPEQQPVMTVTRFLDEEKQKIADLKDERELVELLKEQMDGTVSLDHAVIDGAPESIQRELQLHHLDLLC